MMRKAFASRRATSEPSALVIHAEGSWFKSIQDGKFDFFTKLVRHATKQGISSRIVATGGSTSRLLLDQDHINIIVGDQPSYGANRMHVLPGYIWGFWYLDEVGVFANSSLRFARFAAEEIDADKAEYFFNGVSGHMLRENVSKAPQEVRMKNPMRAAAAVIYCQDIEHLTPRTHFLTTEQMIRTAAETCKDELVYVKPHPSQNKTMRKVLMDIAADYQNVIISDASIHDLTDAARMVLTQNSAVGFEALMQKRCVITCAKSDYWHATLTPKTVPDLKEALQYGPEAMSDFPYAKYFYWFLERNSLEPAKAEFEKRAWSKIQEKFAL